VTPLVSVILPCFNAGAHLGYAINSIREQRHTNLQIICVDDGSTDETLKELERQSHSDPRIEIIRHDANRGLVAALNSGIAAVRGDFFARMDQDDYSPPHRIATQLEFLDARREVDLVSGGYLYFERDDKPREYVPPVATRPAALAALSMFSTPLCHPAAFGRRKLIDSGVYRYDPAFEHCEDFELFSRLCNRGVKLANIRGPLHWLRRNPTSSSVVYFAKQVEAHTRVAARNIGFQLGDNAIHDPQVLRVVCNRFEHAVSFRTLRLGLDTLRRCIAGVSSQLDAADRKEVSDYAHRYLTDIVLQANKAGFRKRGIAQVPYALRSSLLISARGYAHTAGKLLHILN
jgi:glycosyltransferase involved in cell wall biosynthesis